MELKRFDLLWRSSPAETCLHDGADLEIREAVLEVGGPQAERYAVDLARCPQCGQWQGPLPLVYEIMEDFGWDAPQISGFAVEGEPATAGLELGGAALPWAAFGEQMQAMQEASEGAVPPGEEIRSLEQTSASWEVGQAPTTWIEEEAGEATLGYVAVVHGPVLARATDIQVGAPFEAEELGALVRRAAGTPHPPAEPTRPRRVRVREEALANALRPRLSGLDIEVEVGPVPLAEEVLEEITSMLLGHSAPPVFAEESEEEIRAFMETATRFYEQEPWVRTEGDRFLGVKVREDGDWFFANVMGQMEESPGLSLFGDWLSVCRFVHNQRSPFLALAEEFGLAEELGPLGEMTGLAPVDPLEVAGGLEALSLSERKLLHPLDAERLEDLSLDPPVQRGPAGGEYPAGGQYPVPVRFEAGEGPVAPRFSLEVYRLVAEALLLALDRRRATPVTSIKTTLDIDGTEVFLRYPSDGTERPWSGPPGYRLLLEGHDEDLHSPSRIPKGERLVIEAPARALYKDVSKALGDFHDQIYEATLRERGRAASPVCLWDDTASRRNPSPRVGDLAEPDQPGGLEVEIGGAAFRLRVEEALPEEALKAEDFKEAPEEIQIRWATPG